MRKILVSLYGVLFLALFSIPAFSMVITPFDTAANLAQSLVGSGVTISNVTYTGSNGASGYFTGGTAAGIGINSGIVLTTGYASNLNGTTNTQDSITGNNGLSGVSYLNALIPGYTTNDATVLAFDFVSTGTEAYFAYVFGSEEYNEYVGTSYNDVFGFFVNGTALTDNVATLPDGTVVSINNINTASKSSYYNNNDPTDLTPTPFNFEYDGFTDPLVASILGLTAGDTYHLTLAIADAGDHILDSGVFLAAGTFGTDIPDIPTPEPSTFFLIGIGIVGLLGGSRGGLIDRK